MKVTINETGVEVVLKAYKKHRSEFLQKYNDFQTRHTKEGDTLELTQEFEKWKESMIKKCLFVKTTEEGKEVLTPISDEDFYGIELDDHNILRDTFQKKLFPESAGNDQIFF